MPQVVRTGGVRDPDLGKGAGDTVVIIGLGSPPNKALYGRLGQDKLLLGIGDKPGLDKALIGARYECRIGRHYLDSWQNKPVYGRCPRCSQKYCTTSCSKIKQLLTAC